MMVPRMEVEEIRKMRRLILYGRRKVGKTFIVKKFLKPTHYFFVFSRNVINLYKEKVVSFDYESFREFFLELIKNEKNFVAIDEFQRLDVDFLNFIHMISSEIKSKLFLISSSNSFVNKILSVKSPILGLFQVYKLGLIRTTDAIKHFHKIFPKRDLLKGIIFFRDPWLFQFYEDDVDRAIMYSLRNVPGLIGEIFREEGREITTNYEMILRAISLGNYQIKDIASFMGKKSQDVKSFVMNLMEMGIIYRVKIFGKKKHLYLIESPIIDLYYYLDTKYGIEVELSKEIFRKALHEKIPFYFENFVRRYFAEKIGGNEEKMENPEIDGIITVGKQPKIVIEVKLGKISKEDLRNFEEKTRKFKCEKRIVNFESLISKPL